ncbi:unnamed protein product [Candidula unifasciata]|uniref:BTB domain-containing protein n=1 Tax=Candidula unifasciata TaxID=100452 RepID=A0A8S3YTB4_9EUPU|nr:unnamed protein product [Candidula unifasciata]
MSKRNHPGSCKKRLPTQKSNSIIQPPVMAESGGDILLKGDIIDHAEMMRKLINNPEYSDLKFYIGPNRKIIYAHRCIMSARCAVFKAMLAEKNNSDEKDVPYVLPDVSPSIFLAMLEFIYTNCVTLSPNTATDLLATALEYGLDGLRDLCVDYLVTNLSVSNACDVMQSAVTYNQNDLKEKAIVFIEDNTAEIVKSKSFQEINEDALVAILQSSRLTIDEMDLYKAVKDWSSVNSVVNRKKIHEMAREAVKHLRLSLLSPNELTALEEENKSAHFIPVESFAYAWKMHALKCGDSDNVLSRLRRGTVSRDHHKYLSMKNTE